MESNTEEPHRTSKVFSLSLKEDFLVIGRTACTTCDFAFITMIDDGVGREVSSSDDSLESEDAEEEEESSPCSELSTIFSELAGALPAGDGVAAFGGNIWTILRSSCVMTGEQNVGSGRGCLATRACEVNGRQPVLTSTKMSRWRKRLGQTSSLE